MSRNNYGSDGYHLRAPIHYRGSKVTLSFWQKLGLFSTIQCQHPEPSNTANVPKYDAETYKLRAGGFRACYFKLSAIACTIRANGLDV